MPFAISIGRDDPDYRELAGRQGFFKAAGGEVLDTAADAPFLLNGVMDLVFLEEGGWVVADYKSDRLDDPTGRRTRDEILREKVGFYAPQVKLGEDNGGDGRGDGAVFRFIPGMGDRAFPVTRRETPPFLDIRPRAARTAAPGWCIRNIP